MKFITNKKKGKEMAELYSYVRKFIFFNSQLAGRIEFQENHRIKKKTKSFFFCIFPWRQIEKNYVHIFF